VHGLVIGLSYLGIAAAPSLAVACAAAFAAGTGNGIQWVALVSAVQELTEERYQARVVSVLESAASAAPGVGFLAGGAIATLAGPRASFAVAGAGVLLVLAIAAVSLRHSGLWERRSVRAERPEGDPPGLPDPLHSPP